VWGLITTGDGSRCSRVHHGPIPISQVSYNTLLGLLVGLLPPADYIMKRKMVPIEEAATEFGLRSSEVVDRIQVGILAAACCAAQL
jgi:hypothetical protein